MNAKEWLELMQKAQDFPKGMEKLIVKYGEMLINEQKLSHPVTEMVTDSELGIIFENNSDCYADTGFHGDVVMALTKEKFIRIVRDRLTQPKTDAIKQHAIDFAAHVMSDEKYQDYSYETGELHNGFIGIPIEDVYEDWLTQPTDAVEFAEYLAKLNAVYHIDGWWVNNNSDINPRVFKTTQQLYKLFTTDMATQPNKQSEP